MVGASYLDYKRFANIDLDMKKVLDVAKNKFHLNEAKDFQKMPFFLLQWLPLMLLVYEGVDLRFISFFQSLNIDQLILQAFQFQF